MHRIISVLQGGVGGAVGGRGRLVSSGAGQTSTRTPPETFYQMVSTPARTGGRPGAMLKKLLIGVAVVLAVFAGYVMTRPDTYHVERSTQVAAPAEAVFATLADFKSFTQWSPWQKRDPAM